MVRKSIAISSRVKPINGPHESIEFAKFAWKILFLDSNEGKALSRIPFGESVVAISSGVTELERNLLIESKADAHDLK